MPWIQRRSEVLRSINSYLSSRFPIVATAKGYRATRWRLPWSLWIWGDPNCMRYIYFNADEFLKEDRDKINELKKLFPEADVGMKTNAEWSNLRNLYVPP